MPGPHYHTIQRGTYIGRYNMEDSVTVRWDDHVRGGHEPYEGETPRRDRPYAPRLWFNRRVRASSAARPSHHRFEPLNISRTAAER